MDMETVFGMAFMLPLFGGLIMTVMPREWQSLSGWLMVSYLGLPGFIAVLARPTAIKSPGEHLSRYLDISTNQTRD